MEYVQNFLLTRLQQPHPSIHYLSYVGNFNWISFTDIEESFQTYSSFTTNYLPPQEYESILISASKVRGQSMRNFDRRERLETNIVIFPFTICPQSSYKHLPDQLGRISRSIPPIHWIWTSSKISWYLCYPRSSWTSDLRSSEKTIFRRNRLRRSIKSILDKLSWCFSELCYILLHSIIIEWVCSEFWTWTMTNNWKFIAGP